MMPRGESGLSPYEILFGRERYRGSAPYQPPTECEDAQQFFERMDELDKRVAKTVNEIHERYQARINAKRKRYQPLPVGHKVWYYRPPSSGNKLDTRWIGRMEVIARQGEGSYLLSSGPGTQTITATREFLKEYWEDEYSGPPVPLYFYKRTPKARAAPLPDLRIKHIKGHKRDDVGNIIFQVHHEGEDVLSSDYHPVKAFLDENAKKLVKYCRENGLTEDLGIFSQE